MEQRPDKAISRDGEMIQPGVTISRDGEMIQPIVETAIQRMNRRSLPRAVRSTSNERPIDVITVGVHARTVWNSSRLDLDRALMKSVLSST